MTRRDVPQPEARWIEVRRTARYYVMGGEDQSQVRELWILLHGYSQLAGEFIRYFADLADGTRMLVAPEALNRYYRRGLDVPAAQRPVGATWMTREDRDHEILDQVGYLDALHHSCVEALPHPVRVVVLGFSQGAATASRWLSRGDARVDHLVLWGGIVPADVVLDASSPLHALPTTLVVGTADQFLPPDAVEAERQRLTAAGVVPRMVTFDGGHLIRRDIFPELLQGM
jgi:predicted esterase